MELEKDFNTKVREALSAAQEARRKRLQQEEDLRASDSNWADQYAHLLPELFRAAQVASDSWLEIKSRVEDPTKHTYTLQRAAPAARPPMTERTGAPKVTPALQFVVDTEAGSVQWSMVAGPPRGEHMHNADREMPPREFIEARVLELIQTLAMY